MDREVFIMYAINVNNAPYIVEEEDVATFLENSKKQEGIAEKLGSIFPKEWFQFKEDENRMLSVTIDVQ